MRSAVVAPSLVALLACPAISACNGSLREKIGESDVDASPMMTIPPPSCDSAASTDDSGECTAGAHPGSDCLMCHHQGGTASPYAFAGTLYDASGTRPIGGATIYVQDSAGNVATAIARPNGNFYTADGFVTYPAKVFVSMCPCGFGMVPPAAVGTAANCNTSGCHTAGFRIHLP
jgi:hypothetical protein